MLSPELLGGLPVMPERKTSEDTVQVNCDKNSTRTKPTLKDLIVLLFTFAHCFASTPFQLNLPLQVTNSSIPTIIHDQGLFLGLLFQDKRENCSFSWGFICFKVCMDDRASFFQQGLLVSVFKRATQKIRVTTLEDEEKKLARLLLWIFYRQALRFIPLEKFNVWEPELWVGDRYRTEIPLLSSTFSGIFTHGSKVKVPALMEAEFHASIVLSAGLKYFLFACFNFKQEMGEYCV